MTFQQLMYVVEISKCGSINKAANKLFLSQSAISTAVHELESELNITLFTRTNKGVELTADGREFLGFAASLLEQKRQLESLYRDNSSLTVTTRLSVSTQRFPFSESAFIRVLQNTRDNRYRYAIRETGMDAVIDDVYDHRADLGVIYLNETNIFDNHYDYYFLNPDGSAFAFNNGGVSVSPFHAWFSSRGNQLTEIPTLRIVLNGMARNIADPSGITEVKEEQEGETVSVYTLEGVQVATCDRTDIRRTLQSLPKGIYVAGGRKYMR